LIRGQWDLGTQYAASETASTKLEPDDPGDAAGQSTVNRELSLLRRAFTSEERMRRFTCSHLSKICCLTRQNSCQEIFGAGRVRAEKGQGSEVSMGGTGGELYDMLVNQKFRRDTLCPEYPWVFSGTNRGNRGKSTRQLGKPIVQIRHNREKEQGVGLGAKLFHDLRRTATRNLIRA
jgi:hypothetical protein